MKKILILLAAALTACQSPTGITPKPDVSPSVVSNDKARVHIKETKKHVEDTGKDIESGNSKLDNVDLLLGKLLNE